MQDLATARILMDLAASSLDWRAQTALRSTAHISPCTVAGGHVRFQSDPDEPNPTKDPLQGGVLAAGGSPCHLVPPHPYGDEPQCGIKLN